MEREIFLEDEEVIQETKKENWFILLWDQWHKAQKIIICYLISKGISFHLVSLMQNLWLLHPCFPRCMRGPAAECAPDKPAARVCGARAECPQSQWRRARAHFTVTVTAHRHQWTWTWVRKYLVEGAQPTPENICYGDPWARVDAGSLPWKTTKRKVTILAWIPGWCWLDAVTSNTCN